MSKITLEVNEKHLSEVLVILKSLKTGMITKLNIENKNSELKTEESTATVSKYLSKEMYKNKYNTPTVSNEIRNSRYLTPQEFKQKLSKEKS